jgi:tyrosine-protein kinase Etk/Wzc
MNMSNESINNNNLSVEEESNGFDYKALLLQMFMHWPWILGSVIVVVTAAYFYMQTLNPVYTVSSSILIKTSDKKGDGLSGLEELGYVSTSINGVDNAVELFRSRTLLKKVVNELEFYIRYYKEGAFRDSEMYKSTPIQVWVSPEDAQKMQYARVDMNLIDEKQLEVEVRTKDGQRYNKVFNQYPAVLPTSSGIFTFSHSADSLNIESGMHFYATIEAPTDVAADYVNTLQLYPRGKTTITDIYLKTSNVQRSIDFLDKLVQMYNNDANNDKNEVATKTAQFIDERIQIINKELGITENEIAEFKQRAGMLDVASSAGIALSEKSGYEKAYEENATQLQLIEYLRKYLNDNNSRDEIIPANIGVSDNSLSTVIGRYNDMLIERKRLLRTSSESNPAVANLDTGIKLMRENVLLAIQTAEKTMRFNQENLKRQLAKFTGRMTDAPVQEKELLSISRQQEIKANLYIMLLQKREENNIALASTANNARIIDEPMGGEQVSPKSIQIYGIAFVAGLGIPVGIITLLMLLNFKIYTRGDVEKLTSLPIIGDVPLDGDAKNSKQIVVQENSNNLMDEVFRSIRTNVQYMLQNDQKVILFTSTISGEGKSFSVGNLATSFAFMGKKVILVGLDIRKPGLNRVFQIAKKEKGITQYLSDPQHVDLLSLCQQSTVSSNLYLLPGGSVPPNPTELVARHALVDAIEILKKNFDYVLLDTAPIGMVTDTLLVSRVADISVYVCRSGYTHKSEFKLVNELKQESKIPHPCILLNGIDMSKKQNGYYYGYGRYGNYGKKYGYGKQYGYGYGYGYGDLKNKKL